MKSPRAKEGFPASSFDELSLTFNIIYTTKEEERRRRRRRRRWKDGKFFTMLARVEHLSGKIFHQTRREDRDFSADERHS
jgi:hypothetical protein